MNPDMRQFPARQRGAVLAVALVILLVMTLLGISAMQGTTLEEKMAGNQRDQHVAFQAAESALRFGETQLNAMVSMAGFGNGSNGLYAITTADDPYASATWTTSKSIAASDVVGVSTQPRYYIKHIGNIVHKSNNLAYDPNYQPTSGGDVKVFRITARGTGATDDAQVILRSNFGIAGL